MTRVVHCRKEPYDVYIGRGLCPVTRQPSIWANEYSHRPNTLAKYQVTSRAEAIACYERDLRSDDEKIALLIELRGKILGCWCKPKSCHGDVLVRLLNEYHPLNSLERLFV